MDEVLTLPLTELVRALAEKRVSPVELMGAALARIDAVDQTINAVVTRVDPDTLHAQAKAAEARIARGEARPLEGIPLGVKDLEDVEGLVTSYGSVPFKDAVAKRDSTQVARLKAAGAIVVGKTNTPEFGSNAYTRNLLFGVTCNPWNLEYSPGGSSGGSSAALVAGMLPLVTASDGGGSVRIPASFVGAFGLKPTFGRIPMGPSDRWMWLDTVHFGPITRTVEDAAYFLDRVVGESDYDPNALPHPHYSYRERLGEPLPELRIGFSPDFGRFTVLDEVATAVEGGVRALEQLGHRVTALEGTPPNVTAGWVYANNVEEYCHLAPLLPAHENEFGRGFISSVKQTANTSWANLEQWIERRAETEHWFAEAFQKHDVLVTPTMPYDAIPARGGYPTELDGQSFAETPVSAFTVPFNVTGHPAATVRVGISKRNIPIGMQIVARRHRDDIVLALSHAFERARPWQVWPKV